MFGSDSRILNLTPTLVRNITRKPDSPRQCLPTRRIAPTSITARTVRAHPSSLSPIELQAPKPTSPLAASPY